MPIPDISEEIRKLADQWLAESPGLTPEYINNGLCEEFAEEICRRVKVATCLWDDELTKDGSRVGGHKVIVCYGRYYDAECPDGVDDWREIPFFKRYLTGQDMDNLQPFTLGG